MITKEAHLDKMLEQGQAINRLAIKHQVSFKEIEQQMAYKPSFTQLATILGLGKRTFYNLKGEGQLQSITIDNVVLLKLTRANPTALWLDINELDPDTSLIITSQWSTGGEIDIIALLTKLNQQQIEVDDNAWEEMLNMPALDNGIPEILQNALQQIACFSQQLKLLQQEIADNLIFAHNCAPAIPDKRRNNNEYSERTSRAVRENHSFT